jgi:hypothetical protein
MDDIAAEVIEAKLVSAIDDIFSPVKMYQMSPELVSRIAGESEDSRTESEQLNRQLAVLGNGLHTCKRFAGFRVGGGESCCLCGFGSLPRSNCLQTQVLFPLE